MSPVDQLDRALEDTGQLIAAVRADQWLEPTPCDRWTVRDLVTHLVAGNQVFASALRGDASPAHVPAATNVTEEGMLAVAYRDSAVELLAAFGLPGVLERVVTVPFGSVPGMVALHLRLVEALVHGWDLARATGLPPTFAGDLVEQGLIFTQATLGGVPPERSPFGPPKPVADTAPAIDRLAALIGRDVDAGAVR